MPVISVSGQVHSPVLRLREPTAAGGAGTFPGSAAARCLQPCPFAPHPAEPRSGRLPRDSPHLLFRSRGFSPCRGFSLF